MNTKLTLRMDEALIRRVKLEAKRRGKSVSQMVGDYFDSLNDAGLGGQDMPPVTSSLMGILKGRRISESQYKKRLREKYL